MPVFDIKKVTFEVSKPHNVGQWFPIAVMEHEAFSNSYTDRNSKEIDTLIGFRSPDEYRHFRKSRVHPNSSNKFNDNLYFSPLTAIARYNDRPVGFAYAANNVSGRKPKQFAGVMAHVLHVRPAWFTFREIAVDPELQHNGIATILGLLLLERARAEQPVSAYVHAEVEGTIEHLTQLGFKQSGGLHDADSPRGRVDYSFGDDRPPGELITMTTTVAELQAELMAKDNTAEAFEQAKQRQNIPR